MGLKFTVQRTDELTFDRTYPLSEFYVLSPCVWKEHGIYRLLLRAVNRSDVPAEKVARIYYGTGKSALHFVMDHAPAIAPGPGADDQTGCEDPTLASDDGCYYVYYTGWNQQTLSGHLLFATGNDIRQLHKRGRVFRDPERYHNSKEATIVRAADGTWRLFFEFAEDNRSKIGIARADNLEGPWRFQQPLFYERPESWDSWHLSTGPVSLIHRERPVMFYNGSNRDAQWRIGWIEFDECFRSVTARCEQPIITPPQERDPGDTDIAFAASAVEEGDRIGLYYTVSDHLVMRSMLGVER